MKKIYYFIFFAIALLAFAPVSKALDDDPPYVEKDGLCYSKTVGKPNTRGEYTITLESFVTGSVSLTNESKPADIVLVLDLSQSMTQSYNNSTRLAALQDALEDFLEVIYHNDNYKTKDNSQPRNEPLGNQISVVTFAGGQNNTNVTRIRSNLTPVTTITDGVKSKNTSIISYVLGLDTGNSSATGIDNTAHQGTYSDEGMDLANDVLEDIDDARKEKATRTVVLFTDGAPGSGPNWTTGGGGGWGGGGSSTTNSPNTANRCIQNAYIAKNTHGATVFTVILGSIANEDMGHYLDYTSSNYPKATSLTASGDPNEDTKVDYSMEAGGDLSSVFVTIAETSGGSDMDLTNSTVAQVDVVSASFTIPKDFTGMSEEAIQAWADANIKLYTARYNGTSVTIDGKDYLQFDAKKAKGADGVGTYYERETVNGVMTLVGDPIRVDRDLKVTLAASTPEIAAAGKRDIIQVDGFDYANNFCGPDDLTPNPGYIGHKVVVEIPIKMDPNAVGGPDCDTNGPGSGLVVKDADGNVTVSIPFEMKPKVSLPVNIHIRKEGLAEGESAKFKIQRKYVNDSDVPAGYGANTWKDVTSVFVTRHKNQAIDGKKAPITKVMGMPSTDEADKPFVYQVVEEPWSWSYTSKALTPVTSDALVENPFIFSNSKKDNIDVKVRNAESKVTNTFRTGGGATYDDSRNNNRTVITVETQTQ